MSMRLKKSHPVKRSYSPVSHPQSHIPIAPPLALFLTRLLPYVDTDSEYDWETRQQATMQSWGFACKCSVCRKPTAQIEHSDKRLRMIKVLKDLLNDWTEDRPDRAKMAELMIELYQQERLYIGIATAYEAAAYAYSVMGDEYNTMLYA